MRTATAEDSVMAAASSTSWKAQYERDISTQKCSGPIVFTEEQRRKNRELCGRVQDLLPFEDAYKVSDCDLMYRFLIGKHWNVAATEKGLREYVQLRKSDRLDSIIAEQLDPAMCAVLCPLHKGEPCPIYGLDKEGLPVLWLSPDATKLVAAMKECTNEQLMRGQLRSMELGRYACLEHKVDRCTYVIDLGGISMSSVNKATLAMLKGVMKLLQVAYPEIMRRLLIFNTGWAVSAAWKVLRPLVDVRVQDKIKFESGPPTLAALLPYMAADQVHPSLGGTGTTNVLDPIIAAEVTRLRQKVEGSPCKAGGGGGSPALRATDSPMKGGVTTGTPRAAMRVASMESRQNTSVLDPEAITLYSICSNSPYDTAHPTPCEGPGAARVEAERMLIGRPSAVAAYVDKANTELAPRNALDLSLSGESSSDDYAFPAPEDSGDEASGVVWSHGGVATRGQSQLTGSVLSPSQPARGVTFAPPQLPERSDAAAQPLRQQHQQPRSAQAVVAIALTYGADGSISGHCGRRWVGRFRDGVLYVPGPGTDGNGGSGLGERAGELLSEAGHPVHNFLIVCDAQRRVRYLLRESLLRTRLSVFNIVGDAVVQTGKSNRHYVEGERAKLGVVVPHVHAATCGGKGAWMLYGEDVTRRSSTALKPLRPLQHFFAKPKLPPSTKADKSASSSGEGPQDGPASSGGGSVGGGKSWPSSVIAALRSSGPFLPVKRKGRQPPSGASTERGQPAPSQGPLRNDSGAGAAEAAPETVKAEEVALLLAECKGQTVSFYNLLATNPVTDLFALAVAITTSWSHEVEGSRSKRASAVKATRYMSEDDSTP